LLQKPEPLRHTIIVKASFYFALAANILKEKPTNRTFLAVMTKGESTFAAKIITIYRIANFERLTALTAAIEALKKISSKRANLGLDGDTFTAFAAGLKHVGLVWSLS